MLSLRNFALDYPLNNNAKRYTVKKSIDKSKYLNSPKEGNKMRTLKKKEDKQKTNKMVALKNNHIINGL